MRRVLSLVPLCSLVALASACRCSWFAPGLGPGVEGMEKPGPRTQAQAIASLAFVTDGNGGPGTAPVLAVRGGRVYLLALDGVYRDSVGRYKATFTSEAGKRETVEGAALEAGARDDFLNAGVLSFPAPSFPVHAVVIAPAAKPPAANAIRAVTLTPNDKPAIEPASAKNEISSDAPSFTVRVTPRGGGETALFDAQTWHLVGLGRGGFDEVQARGAAVVARLFAGSVRSARLALERSGDGCRVTAQLDLDDPLGSMLEAGLVVGEPGVAWAIPAPRGPGKGGERGAGDQVLPVAKRLAARAKPGADRKVVLSADAKSCDEPRFAQLVVLGERDRWLSVPYRIGGEAGAAAVVVADASAWRVDEIAASEPLVWKGTPLAAPPAAQAQGDCRPPLGKLDPAGIYLAARRGKFDAGCSDGVLVFPVDAEERAQCAQSDALLAVAADGFPVYRVKGEHDWETVAWRRAVPDRNAPDADASCKLAAPQDDDDVLAAGPCPRSFGDSTQPTPFFGPDGELVFACGTEYRRRDGSVVDFQGGALIRLGDQGTALVQLPWGMLGVLGADGKGHEVGGLPLEARFDFLPASAAVEDGFLIAIEVGIPGSNKHAPELFHVSFEGVATSQGKFGEVGDTGLGAASGKRYLGSDGALYTWEDNTYGSVVRWRAGGEKEVLYDPRARAAEDRLDVKAVLPGWRSALTGRGPFGPFTKESTPTSRALAAYALADPASLPCKPTLDELDPDRAWVRVSGKLFDPADPDRYVWVPYDASLRISGAGRVLLLSKESGFEHPERTHVEPLSGPATLRPSTQSGTSGCVRFAGAPPGAAVTGGACSPPGRPTEFGSQTPWAAVPGEAGAGIQCTIPGTSDSSVVGGVPLPSRFRLAHVGLQGRLLATTEPWPPRFASGSDGSAGEWLLVLGDGKLVPVTGLPGRVLAVRATPDGFALAVDPMPAAGAPRPVQPARADGPPALRQAFLLVVVGDDGRPRKSGTYAPLAAGAEIEGAALTKDSALHVLVPGANFNGTPRRLLKLPLDAREPELEWSGPAGSPGEAQVLTGP